jgi:hypothetical protein
VQKVISMLVLQVSIETLIQWERSLGSESRKEDEDLLTGLRKVELNFHSIINFIAC